MRATRSSEPIEGITHGVQGWNKGCGCFVCRRAKAEAQARYRAKVRGEEPADPDKPKFPKGAGKQEKLTLTEIHALGTLSDEGESLANLALMNAKLIDTIQAESKWHLLSTTIRSLRETMKDLKATLPAASRNDEEDEDDFAASLRRPGQP